MNVLFFRVENVLNFDGSEAKAPDGRLGIVDKKVKELRDTLGNMPPGTQLVLYGEWTNDWDFDDAKCTENGKYLNRKLERRGLHIMDKTDSVMEYIQKKHVEKERTLA